MVHDATNPAASPATTPFNTFPSPFACCISYSYLCALSLLFRRDRQPAKATTPRPAITEPAINGCSDALYKRSTLRHSLNIHHARGHLQTVCTNCQNDCTARVDQTVAYRTSSLSSTCL